MQFLSGSAARNLGSGASTVKDTKSSASYLFFHTGFLFSMTARSPSCTSSGSSIR